MLTTIAWQTAQVDAQDATHSTTESLTVSATFQPRASLQVSSHDLRFEVTDATTAAVASLDFSAGVRTGRGDEVRLVIDAVQHISGVLSIAEGPEGTIGGQVSNDEPIVALSWVGGGRRSGRLTFRLLATPGLYTIPINITLTTHARD